jgi:hypothetical protein
MFLHLDATNVQALSTELFGASDFLRTTRERRAPTTRNQLA